MINQDNSMRKRLVKKLRNSSGWKCNFLFRSFWLAGGISITYAFRIGREVQDAWIGADIWPLIVVILTIYAWLFAISDDTDRLTILAVGLTFLLNVIPALKYQNIYGSAQDQAVHLSTIRNIQIFGATEPGSLYEFTPGFHSVTAVFANLAGISAELSSKFISGLMGSLIPIGFSLFCFQYNVNSKISKWAIFFSGLSSPLLYILNGTRFTAPVFVFVILLIVIRAKPDLPYTKSFGYGYSVLSVLFLFMIVFWHPSTTVVLIATLILASLLSLIYQSLTKLDLHRTNHFIQLATLTFVVGFGYWMFRADLVWDHFVRNISLAIEAYITQDLIPARFFDISLQEQVIISLFYHSRDIVLTFFAIIGSSFLYLKDRTRKTSIFGIRLVGFFWIASLAIMAIVFASDFGAQGYNRFMIFTISLSPLLAGYGFEKIKTWLDNRNIGKHIKQLSVISILWSICLFSAIELFPPQFLMPKLEEQTDNKQDATPILWLHQVNSDYQYMMIDFALNQLEPEQQILTDYWTSEQVYQFFGLEASSSRAFCKNQNPEPAFIMLHWPDLSGGFREQAEFRSREVIGEWRFLDRVSTIYDNGQSFILYYPDNPVVPFSMETIP